MRARSVVVALGLVALVGGGAHPVTAASVSQTGVVTRVFDGDTVAVDIAGDGTSTPVTVRNAGIQSMELGECHADAATQVMRSAALGRQVRVTAVSSTSSSLGRPLRHVDANVDGTWVDTQLPVLRAGLALWFPNAPETARATEYHRAMADAAARRVGLFDDDACGVGPAAGASLRVWANYEGDDDESKNPNAEWVTVLNRGTTVVDLSGWTIRTAAHDSYRLPSGTVLGAGKPMRLHVGRGTNTTSVLHWGFASPRFPNLTATARIGSGAYLFDPQGDLRAHATYPCVLSCADPARGAVRITAHPDATGDDALNVNGEYVTITSLVDRRVDLSWYVVQVGGNTRELGAGSVLGRKGSTIRVYVGRGKSTATVKYWGKLAPIMTNAGGTAELRTTEAVRISCARWGTGTC